MPEYRPEHAPVAMLEFDAHEAARIYLAFADSLVQHEAAIVGAISNGFARAAADRADFLMAWRESKKAIPTDLPAHYDGKAKARIAWLIKATRTQAAIVGAGTGRAWLPLDDVGRLLAMRDGITLANILRTGIVSGVIAEKRNWGAA